MEFWDKLKFRWQALGRRCKNMRKLAFTIIFIAVVLAGLLLLNVGHAALYESGTISTSAEWTSANSHTLTGNVVVAYGASLTIDPGVTVNLGIYQIIVNGQLYAQGTNSQRIVFSGTASSSAIINFASPGMPSTISNATFSSVAIGIQAGSITIGGDYFSGASNLPIITVNNGYAAVSGSVLNMISEDGIDVFGGSALITGNTIDGQGQCYGVFVAANAGATVNNNNIIDCFTGVWAVGSTYIEQNNVMNNAHDGVNSASASSTIEFNAIAGNLCGVSGNGTIQYNTITGNSWGIWGPFPSGSISNNNIFNNLNSTGYPQNIHLVNTNNIVAANNWWGTTDQASISQTIWDFTNDSANLGVLTFEPVLSSPVTLAPNVPASIPIPTAPPTPSPTATAATPSPSSPDYNTPSPVQSYLPRTITPGPIVGVMKNSDLESILVIASAFIAAAAIIVAINVKFGRAKAPQPTKRRRRRRKNVKPDSAKPAA